MAKKQKLDGGQVALIGFLYQMIGALSLLAWAKNPKLADEPANLEALLAVINKGEIYHERGDVVLLLDMVDNSTSPLQTHFWLIFS